MNREIKFRAWDLTDNKWFYSSSDPLKKFNDDNWTGHEDGELIWQQYTGLKDKNGKEIYEGDILQLDEIIGSVIYDDGAFQMILDDSAGRSVLLQDRTKRFEVIGNIYENPNLIK